MHIHVRGVSAPITDQKVENMARAFSDLVQVFAATPTLHLHLHVKFEIPNGPMIEPRTGALIVGKALSRFGGPVIQERVKEFSFNLNTNTKLDGTMFDHSPRNYTRPSWRGNLKILNVKYERNQWRWGTTTNSNRELGDALLNSPCDYGHTELRLGHGELRTKQSTYLRDFLRNNSSTLKEIHLKRITLPCRGWTSLLKFMQTPPHTVSATTWFRQLQTSTIEQCFEQYKTKGELKSRVVLFEEESATGSATGKMMDETMLVSLGELAIAMHRMDRGAWCVANNLHSETLRPIIASLKVTREVLMKKRKAGNSGGVDGSKRARLN